MTLISVIVPVYNTEKFLRRCVDSILRQTYENLEIILINDGSTDNSARICDEYAAKDARVKVIHQANAGLSAARNAGLDSAHGEWLGFVDSDDYIEETMFEELLQAALGTGKQLAVCGFLKYHYNGTMIDRSCPQIPTVLSREKALPYLLSQRYFCGFMCNKLFCKSIFAEGERLDEDTYFLEDLPFVLRVFLKIDGIAYVPKALYRYDMQEGSLTGKFSEQRMSDELLARKQILDTVRPISKELEKLTKAWYSATAAALIYLAADSGNEQFLPMLRKEAFKYKFDYLTSKDLSLKQKAGHLLISFFPKLGSAIVKGLRS